jgi:dihydroflavonol-4-reductase
MTNKILVTGGTGFIGSNLVKELYKRNKQKNEVTIFAENPYHPFLKGLKLKRIIGDVRDYNVVYDAIKENKYVYHLAACSLNSPESKDKLFSINVLGTENVMKACLKAGVKKAVHVSSVSALGFSNDEKIKLSEKDYLDFKDHLYGQSKKLGEDKVQEYVAKGLNATIVLPAYVVGAGEINPERYTVFQSIAKGRIGFTYPGGGGTVAVEDVVEGIILAMEKGKAGHRYILNNQNISLFNSYNLIAKILNKPKIRIKLPKISYYPMYFIAAILQKIFENPPVTTEAIRWFYNFRYYDSTKARKELGWKPKIPLEESYKRAIDYYKKIKAL